MWRRLYSDVIVHYGINAYNIENALEKTQRETLKQHLNFVNFYLSAAHMAIMQSTTSMKDMLKMTKKVPIVTNVKKLFGV